MKFLLSIVASAVICYFTQTILMDLLQTWWLFAIGTFLVALIIQLKSGWMHFLSGMIPVFAVWLILFYQQNAPNDSILSEKIAALFSMPNHHILFIVVSIVMGLIGGLASVAGGSLRRKK